jgi:ribosomal protein L12E/L44/L45/RPP1/RPP2
LDGGSSHQLIQSNSQLISSLTTKINSPQALNSKNGSSFKRKEREEAEDEDEDEDDEEHRVKKFRTNFPSSSATSSLLSSIPSHRSQTGEDQQEKLFSTNHRQKLGKARVQPQLLGQRSSSATAPVSMKHRAMTSSVLSSSSLSSSSLLATIGSRHDQVQQVKQTNQQFTKQMSKQLQKLGKQQEEESEDEDKDDLDEIVDINGYPSEEDI